MNPTQHLGIAIFLATLGWLGFSQIVQAAPTTTSTPPAKASGKTTTSSGAASKSSTATAKSSSKASSSTAAKKKTTASTSKTTSKTTAKKTTKKTAPRPRGQQSIEPQRIVDIQTALAKAGFYKEPPSGKWDIATTEAMKEYQLTNGFKVTGKPDALSLKKMGL